MKIIKILWNKNIVLFLMLCFIQNIYSQKDFRKGFIITNKKDTLRGFIDYRGGAKKFKSCSFKRTENSDFITIYLPNQIKGYGFYNDSFFESKDVHIKNNEIERVFLEVLVKGKTTLYKLRGTFFVEKDDTIFRKLYVEQQKFIVNSEEFNRRTNRYIGILKYLLSDCLKLKGKINKTSLSEKSLTNLIEKYNACTKGSSVSFKKNKKWFNVRFGLSLGINYSSLTIKPDLPTGISNFSGDFGNESSIIAGFFVELSSPRINDYMSFFAEVSYLNTTYQATDIYTLGVNTERNNVSITLKQIKIPLGFRYTFPEKKITPYFTVGLSNIITTTSNSIWTIENINNNIVQISDGLPFDINNIQLGFWASVGARKKLLEKLNGFIEVRFESLSGTASISSQPKSYNSSNIQFLIGLIF